MMRNKGISGLTLLELMIVMCIAFLLSGFAYLGTVLVRREQVSSITRELLADIHRARKNAITQEGKGFGIRFESSNSYVIFQFNDCNDDYKYDANSCGGGTREETKSVRRTITSSVVLSKTNMSQYFNNDIVIFDKLAFPRKADWGLGLMTILVRNNNDAGIIKCITISTNRVRESIWTGSSCI